MNLPIDSNIPILTEVISVEDSTVAPDQRALAGSETQQERVQEQPQGLSALDLEQLEKTLRENVLRQLLTRVDFVLEHRVRDSLADVLQTAVDGLAKEIRAGLAKSL